MIIALGLGWGAVLSLHIPKSNPGIQQTALADRAPPAAARDTATGGPNTRPLYTPAAGEVGRNTSELVRLTDQDIVPADVARPSGKITPATKSTAVPRSRGNKVRHTPTPTPDTKPNTIEGWKVREVFGGTAVLQGPNGTRKVSVGDMVPGAGQIESIVRWGSRWIVATSRGLITTD